MNEISSEKISVLQNIILERANGQKAAIIADARREAEVWIQKQTEKLEREASIIVNDAKSRSEDIHRRQLLSAEREKSTETLRLQNRLLNQLLKKFQDELVKLRERNDYADILAGLVLEGVRSLAGGEPFRLRLAVADLPLGGEIIAKVKRQKDVDIVLDQTPVPIMGGCWISSEDGKRNYNADWRSQTQESSDVLAERLLALL